MQYTDQSRHYSRASRLMDKAVKEMDSKLVRNHNSISWHLALFWIDSTIDGKGNDYGNDKNAVWNSLSKKDKIYSIKNAFRKK